MGVKKRIGSGFLGFGSAIGKAGLASRDRWAYKARHGASGTGSATFSPHTAWTKGVRGSGRERHFERAYGRGKEGSQLYKTEGDLAQAHATLGKYTGIYKGEGTGEGEGIGAATEFAYEDRGGTGRRAITGWGVGTEAGRNIFGVRRSGTEAGYVSGAFKQGIADPYADWWEGELAESQDFYGFTPSRQALPEELVQSLAQRGIDTSTADIRGLTSDFAPSVYEEMTQEARQNIDLEKEALRDAWITQADITGTAQDDPRRQAREALLERASETFGTTDASEIESQIFEGEQLTSGTDYESIEEPYEAAVETREDESIAHARARIKANLQGRYGVEAARAAAGATGVAASGAHEAAIEAAQVGAAEGMYTTAVDERASVTALEEAKTERGEAYEAKIKDVVGEGGAFKGLEAAEQAKFESGRTYLEDAMLSLTDYAGELESMLDLGPQVLVSKGDITKQKGIDYLQSRPFGSNLVTPQQLISHPKFSTRFPKADITRKSLAPILEQALAQPLESQAGAMGRLPGRPKKVIT